MSAYWILVICGSLLLGSYFVFENVDLFLKAHSTTSVDTTTGPLSNGRFPKISICNSYKVRQSFLDTVFNKSVITDDDSGYDMAELKEAFVKYFEKGYHKEEADILKDKVDVVIEKYAKHDNFNETLVPECPFDPYDPCTFEVSLLESRSDLQLTIGQ